MNRRANKAGVGHRTCFIVSKEKPAASQIVTREVNISGLGSFHGLNGAYGTGCLWKKNEHSRPMCLIV